MVLFLYACEFYIKVFFAPCVSVAKKIADTSTGFLQNLYLLFLGFYRHALTAPETVFLGALVVNRYRVNGLTAIRIARSFSPLLLKAQVAYILYYSEMYLTLVSTSVFSSSASIAKRYVTTSPQSIAARISWMNTMF